MTKPGDRSILYRLIEAGQLTHKALLAPLIERGLEPGDDAVLFLLAESSGATGEELSQGTGIEAEALIARLDRLRTRDLVLRQEANGQAEASWTLTERGARIHDLLAENWQQIEIALVGDLKAKKRKGLRQALVRLVDELKR